MAARKPTKPTKPSRSRLTSRLAHAQADVIKDELDNPSRPEGHTATMARPYFIPSRALAARLTESAVQYPLTISTPEEPETDTDTDIEGLQLIIGETLEAVLYVEARRTAAAGEALLPVATENGRFTDRIAADLTQRLTIRPYDATRFLNALQRELSEKLTNAPINYEWGALHQRATGIVLVTQPATDRRPRNTPSSTFYRDLENA